MNDAMAFMVADAARAVAEEVRLLRKELAEREAPRGVEPQGAGGHVSINARDFAEAVRAGKPAIRDSGATGR